MSTPDAPAFDEARIVQVLDRHGVAYVLVGGLGARLHGATRPTMDFDMCAAWDLDNLGRLVNALNELQAELRVREGIPRPRTDAQLLHDSVVTTWRTSAGDVLVGIPYAPRAGLNRFPTLRSRAEAHVVAGCTVYVAALADIIASKRVANRPADLQILPELEALLSQSPGTPPAASTQARAEPGRGWQPPDPTRNPHPRRPRRLAWNAELKRKPCAPSLVPNPMGRGALSPAAAAHRGVIPPVSNVPRVRNRHVETGGN